VVAGIPTGRFRDRLTQMCANQGLWVVAVDPAYTSQWGREHWLAPMQETGTTTVTVHQAAAVVSDDARLGIGPGGGQVWPSLTGGWVLGRATGQAGHDPGPAEDPTRPRGVPAAPSGAWDRQRQPEPGSGPGGRRPFAAARQPLGVADATGAVIAASLACTWPNATMN
jgi:hypothetical protein